MTFPELKELTLKAANDFNKPGKTVVAINCAHIGDDNDYSCFLTSITRIVFESGDIEKAFKLSQTDTMSGALRFTDIELWAEDMREYYKRCDKRAKEMSEAWGV